MDFRLKIIPVGKFPTLWSLTKLQDFGTHAYLSMCGSNFLLGSSSFDRRNVGNNLLFFFPPFFLSPSVRFSFSHYYFFLSFSPLSYPLNSPFILFAPLLITFLFSIFSFSHFLLPFFLFLISFLLLLFGFSSFYPLSTEFSKWGNLPPLFSFATCYLHNFLNFFSFLILLSN